MSLIIIWNKLYTYENSKTLRPLYKVDPTPLRGLGSLKHRSCSVVKKWKLLLPVSDVLIHVFFIASKVDSFLSPIFFLGGGSFVNFFDWIGWCWVSVSDTNSWHYGRKVFSIQFVYFGWWQHLTVRVEIVKFSLLHTTSRLHILAVVHI